MRDRRAGAGGRWAKLAVWLAGLVWMTGCNSSGLGAEIDGEKDRLVTIPVTEGTIGGPATKGDWDAARAQPNVKCGTDEVRTDDLGSRVEDMVASEGYERPKMDDEEDRCGDDYETLLFRVANCERQKRELPPLSCDMRLVWVGRQHSRDMERRRYFDHVTPEGISADERLDEKGIKWKGTAENIALAPTMALAHTAWMESEGHRKNVLSTEVTHVGFGVVERQRGFMATALFLMPK